MQDPDRVVGRRNHEQGPPSAPTGPRRIQASASPNQTSGPAALRGRTLGFVAPLLLTLVSGLVLLTPALVLAQGASSAAPASYGAWLSAATGLIGLIAGGGALYQQATLSARIAVIERDQQERRKEVRDDSDRLWASLNEVQNNMKHVDRKIDDVLRILGANRV